MINYNIKGKGGEEQDSDLLSWGRGVSALGLAVAEGECLGLVLVLSIFNCTAVSRGVPS